MRTPVVIVAYPGADLFPRVVEAEEQRLVQKFTAHASVKAFAEAVLHGLAWRDVMPSTLLSLVHVRIAFEVNSVP